MDGKTAETLAAWWLRLRLWRILECGLVTGRGTGAGEVDIIARRGSILAFVEVKARPSEAQALAAIHPRQQARIMRAAEAYVARHPELAHLAIRFDAVLVWPGSLPRHLQDAWRMDS
jgi:putative endonuclease